MAIQYKDYYEILGVPRDAEDEAVRRAFRRLARKYHPDKNGNDRRAEERFKEINEAYEVLGDQQKRQRYDEFNSAWQGHSTDEAWARFRSAYGTSSNEPRSRESGFSEFFDELFAEQRAARSGRRRPDPEPEIENRGDDLEVDIFVTLNEVSTGAIRQVSLRRAQRCSSCLGMGQVNARKCEPCNGAGNVPSNISCKIKIPKGIREGALLRIPGRGEEGLPGSQPGDLYLKVRYSSHSEFKFENNTLVYELELAPWEAVLGVDLTVPTLDGRVAIKVPPGTRAGQKLRVRGRGLPTEDGLPGDLFVQIKVQVPGSARDRERELWQELARESGFQARLPHHQH